MLTPGEITLAGATASRARVALTANAVPEDRMKCIDAGMDDYLSKPLALDALRACLERWLSGSDEKQ